MAKHSGNGDNGVTLEAIMTVREIADYLRIHPTSIYRLVNEGRIPAIRIGGQWRFRRSEVLKGLEKDAR